VQQLIATHLRHLLDLGVQGFRIDAAKHMMPKHLQDIFTNVKATGWFPIDISLEVYSNEVKPVKPSMYLDVGNVEYFDYTWFISTPIAYPGRMGELRHVGARFHYPSHNVNVFLDNHDTQRNGGALLTYRNSSLYVLANVFMLAWPYGYPKVMSSFYIPDLDVDRGPPAVPVHDGSRVNCQDGTNWVCEHRIPAIANMVAWRKVAGQAPPSFWMEESGSRIAFSRGSAFVALNRNSSAWTARLQTGLPAGAYCDVSQDDDPRTCPRVVVDSSGFADIAVPGMATVAFHDEAQALLFAARAYGGTWFDLHGIVLCVFAVTVGFLIVLNAWVVRKVVLRSFRASSEDLKTSLLSVESA
jgi:alpha-amylase